MLARPATLAMGSLLDLALATAGVGGLMAWRAFWLASSLATAASMRPDRVKAASPTAISSRRSCMPLMCLRHGMFVALERCDLPHSTVEAELACSKATTG